MKQESTTPTPPVVLEDYADFKGFAKNAAVVVYSPEFFASPFLNDRKRLRRLTLTALGVQVEEVMFTFKYVFDHGELDIHEDTTTASDDLLSEIIRGLDFGGTLVCGSVDMGISLGEALAMRP
ncbi:hypothetical protein EU522_01675 [Candidatus Thorarchaeota archaeon]|nr:MAG: hypothetical protein EU522_01675 [Candidatus Thorarchaeota archaeon]